MRRRAAAPRISGFFRPPPLTSAPVKPAGTDTMEAGVVDEAEEKEGLRRREYEQGAGCFSERGGWLRRVRVYAVLVFAPTPRQMILQRAMVRAQAPSCDKTERA
ncbi:hypothetical protein K438DRAFT_1829861 [Mycena galopus ATCC 62051]|nr:hypothetical protein K438DRAFT_1829861 [Mycena galopus ATCC 62051]